MAEHVFELVRDARGSLVHVRRRDNGEAWSKTAIRPRTALAYGPGLFICELTFRATGRLRPTGIAST